jgi:hypothetical protein
MKEKIAESKKRVLCICRSVEFKEGLSNIFSELPDIEALVINKDDRVWNGSFISKLKLLRNFDILYLFWAETEIIKLLFFKLANVKIINHFIGTDLYRIIKKRRFTRLKIVSWITDILCVSSLLRDELKEFGIRARVLHFTNLELKLQKINYPTDKKAIVYLPESRKKFYNYESVISLAKSFPEIEFILFPFLLTDEILPENVSTEAHIEREDMFEFLSNCRVFIRFTIHDGLPNTLLEALSIGRWCIWSFDFKNTAKAANLDELLSQFNTLIKNETYNSDAVEFIQANYSYSQIKENYQKYFREKK